MDVLLGIIIGTVIIITVGATGFLNFFAIIIGALLGFIDKK